MLDHISQRMYLDAIFFLLLDLQLQIDAGLFTVRTIQQARFRAP